MKRHVIWLTALLFCCSLGVTAAQASIDYTPVTDERLLNPEPENWLHYRGTYDGWGYSPLDQVSTENVQNLVSAWAFSSGVDHNHEAPPIVNDGVMFITTAYNRLYALDAATGDLIWSYVHELADDVFPVVCCDVVNRGVGLYGDKIYFATLDAHLIAFDAKTGEIAWDTTVEDYTQGYTMTLAPLTANGKVVVGVSGGEYGIRGFVEAFDAESGESIWKTYMTPGEGEPGNETWSGNTWQRGGASVWVTGQYDPELNLAYFGTGNGGPWMGDLREGDNLYVASVVALDIDSGELKHHFQYVPNDSWDWDEVAEHILVDVERDGKTIKGALHVARSGYLYLLDRTDLEFIYGEPVVTVNAFKGRREDGSPIADPNHKPAVGKAVDVCPSWAGPKNWNPAAYSPDTGYLYSSIQHLCMTIEGQEAEYQAGQSYIGAEFTATLDPNAPDYTGELAAFDPATGQRVWSSKFPYMRSSILTTGGNLVFAGGTPDRYFRAFDAETGDILWEHRTNSAVYGVPSTYTVDGVQYVAVWSGWQPSNSRWGMVSEAFGMNPEIPQGGVLWVYKLQDQGERAQAE